MAEKYDNTNTIAMFKNDKQGNDKRPDLRLLINIDGTEYRGALWLHQGNGGLIARGKVEPAERREAAPPAGTTEWPRHSAASVDADDNDLPF